MDMISALVVSVLLLIVGFALRYKPSRRFLKLFGLLCIISLGVCVLCSLLSLV